MRAGLVAILLLTGCAAARPRRLQVKPLVTIEFRNVVDGKCTIATVALDAKTGNQVVLCRGGDEK